MRLIDFVEIEVGMEPMQFPLAIPTYLHDKHIYRESVASIRDAAGSIPVLSVIGRITSVEDAEELLASGVVDMVGSIRGLQTEPNLVRHAAEGREDESRTCLACNLCMRLHSVHHAFGCSINPETGREKSWSTYPPAARSSRVVVAGGGPAGLEAARVATMKGHRVLLLERNDHLGGQLHLWAKLPDRQIFSTTTEWYERQLAKLGVEVRLGVEANLENILAEQPDAVIVATGSRYLRTGESGFVEYPVPGWDQDWVLTPEQIIEDGLRPTGNVLILDDEGMNTAAGVAEILAAGGADVTMITRWLQPVQGMISTLEYSVEIPRLKNLGVKLETMTYIKELGEHTATIFNVFTNAETTIDRVDAVVMVTTRRADLTLAKLLEGRVEQLFSAGDALAPRGLTEAIHEGHRFARVIGEAGAPRDFTELYFSPVNYDMFQKPASVLRTTNK
jgi:thioredoxin reductase